MVRVQDGHEAPGRFISPDAYRAFLEGTVAEGDGDVPRAKAAYERTLSEDPYAAEAWSGLGRILCTASPAAADRAFSRARNLDGDMVTPLLSAAACELARGRPEAGAELAQEAARLTPGSPEASRLVAQTLRRIGQTERAERWMRGLRLLGPAGSETGLSRTEPPGPATAPSKDQADVSPPLGTALVRLRAEPRDADARIAVLIAADLAGDETAFASASSPPGAAMDPPSIQAARRLEELLARRVGEGAARAFREAYGAPAAALPGEPAAPTP